MQPLQDSTARRCFRLREYEKENSLDFSRSPSISSSASPFISTMSDNRMEMRTDFESLHRPLHVSLESLVTFDLRTA